MKYKLTSSHSFSNQSLETIYPTAKAAWKAAALDWAQSDHGNDPKLQLSEADFLLSFTRPAIITITGTSFTVEEIDLDALHLEALIEDHIKHTQDKPVCVAVILQATPAYPEVYCTATSMDSSRYCQYHQFLEPMSVELDRELHRLAQELLAVTLEVVIDLGWVTRITDRIEEIVKIREQS